MRARSNKRARLMKRVNPIRVAWKDQWGFCWCCGSQRNVYVHEMVRGGSREAALERPEAWFCACWECNSSGGQLNEALLWPLARQLALKWIFDHGHFNLAVVIELRHEGPQSITMAEVIPHICRELDKAA